MRQLTYWAADAKTRDGYPWRAWYGRVKDRTVRGGWRYFGPFGITILIDAVWRHYNKEALREVHNPAWNDIGPPGWNGQGGQR